MTNPPLHHPSTSQKLPLTPRQQQVLNIIQSLCSLGPPPTVKELADALNVSFSGASEFLRTLHQKGHLRRIPFEPRGIQLL